MVHPSALILALVSETKCDNIYRHVPHYHASIQRKSQFVITKNAEYAR